MCQEKCKPITIHEWVAMAPERIKAVLRSLPVRNSLRQRAEEFRNTQLGSVEANHEQFLCAEAIDSLLDALRRY